MTNNKAPHTLVVGLAFFSMFFGSGNLIFPLMLGAHYEQHFLWCAAGFIITAVLLPTLGILAIIPVQGQYERLFTGLLPEKMARWFFFAILIFWIPLGSGPRCVVLAHASVSDFLPIKIPVWFFSIIFLAIVYVSVISRNKIIDILGKYLTPALVVSIFCIVFSSLNGGEITQTPMDQSLIFFESLRSGYYTQDLIAAVFFGSALIGMLNISSENQSQVLKKTWYAGLIAALMLAILYTALMAASAVHAKDLQHLSGEKLVSELAYLALGTTFGGLSSIAVSLACLTTEIALVLVFADFLQKNVFTKKSNHYSVLLTVVIIFVMSQLEYDSIMSIISLAMQIIYPILFLLVIRILYIFRRDLTKRSSPGD